MNDLLKVPEVCKILGIGKATLKKLVAEGKLPHIRLTERIVRFDPEAIDEWRRNIRQLQFIELESEGEDAKEIQQLQNLALRVQNRREENITFNFRDEQEQGSKSNTKNSSRIGIAKSTAHKISEIIGGDCEGGCKN